MAKTNEVMTWRDVAAKSVASAKATAAAIPTGGGSFLSFRGGRTTYQGQQLPAALRVVVLAHQAERAYYAGPYSPDRGGAPECYSYNGEAPHSEAAEPQSKSCGTCQWNQFGSASNQKGKACKEGVKLALAMADQLLDPEQTETCEIVQARLSVQNAKAWSPVAAALLDADLPLWSRELALTNAPDERTQYKVTWQTGPMITESALNRIAARVAEAERMLTVPHPKFDDAAPAKPAQRKGGRPSKF